MARNRSCHRAGFNVPWWGGVTCCPFGFLHLLEPLEDPRAPARVAVTSQPRSPKAEATDTASSQAGPGDGGEAGSAVQPPLSLSCVSSCVLTPSPHCASR